MDQRFNAFSDLNVNSSLTNDVGFGTQIGSLKNQIEHIQNHKCLHENKQRVQHKYGFMDVCKDCDKQMAADYSFDEKETANIPELFSKVVGYLNRTKETGFFDPGPGLNTLFSKYARFFEKELEDGTDTYGVFHYLRNNPPTERQIYSLRLQTFQPKTKEFFTEITGYSFDNEPSITFTYQ